jgi:hypothetical protein
MDSLTDSWKEKSVESMKLKNPEIRILSAVAMFKLNKKKFFLELKFF